jgi:polyferredoxin
MKNPKIKTKNRRNWPAILRRTAQIGFLAFILIASLRHNLLEETTASIDALCPFGGLETLWRMIVEGEFVPKTHLSNIVLGIGLLFGVVFSGAAFCGWICPFGTLQDGLTWLRKKMHLPEIHVPAGVDRWLRYGRFLVLGLILYQTISTVKLWFSSYDPYRTLFGLGWLFEFNLAEGWPAYLIAILVLLGSFFIPRAWCKYACPLGGTLSLLGNLSFLRIRRNAQACKSCAVCDVPCPVGIAVSQAKSRVSTNCIGCLECVETCPRYDALQVQVAPLWLDSLRALPDRIRRPASASGD